MLLSCAASTTEDAVMEPTVLEQLRICLRAKKLQPAQVVGTLSGNYHGYAQVRPQWYMQYKRLDELFMMEPRLGKRP